MREPLTKNRETWGGYMLTTADVEPLPAGSYPAMNEYGLYPCRCGRYPEVRMIESFIPPCPTTINCYQCRVSIATDQPLAIELWNYYATRQTK